MSGAGLAIVIQVTVVAERFLLIQGCGGTAMHFTRDALLQLHRSERRASSLVLASRVQDVALTF